MACEEERTRLIGQIASLLRENAMPPAAREAGLTLIGWLARRMPGEGVSLAGKEEMLRRCIEHGYSSPHGTNGTNGAHAPSDLNGASGAKGRGDNEKLRGSSRSNGRRAR
ncbi:hypothetical protein [Polyangium spumosum]|uniref:Uncharacterized protein n=1 Tax=Polyangium spumosum TaxID=889282 RepID=A0A6N7Q3H8_9BACT|nr:hypothetical protein [Polyangium spumosum]MRG96854.1 hypothetical protein [Polyangium spumosum]